MFIIEEFDLIRKLKTGDPTVYSRWMELHSEDIERYGIQYGCGREQAAFVAVETFREFYNNLEALNGKERLVCLLYKIMIENLRDIQLADVTKEIFLPFVEDQALHGKISRLNNEEKIPLILSRFHGMDETEISSILGLSEKAVLNSILAAFQQLGDQEYRLEKRLAFLNKSYQRTNTSFNIEDVFQKPQEENRGTVKQSTLPVKVLLSWLAGIVILLVLITVSVMSGEEYQKSSAEKYVDELKTSFADEYANKYTQAGFEDMNEQAGNTRIMAFAEFASEEFETMMGILDSQILNNEKIDEKVVKEQYEEILKKLQLPSELAEQLFGNPLTHDKEKSEVFINRYVEVVSDVQNAYMVKILEHQNIIEEAVFDGEVDIDGFLKEKRTYPKDFQKALGGMQEQNLYPRSIQHYRFFYPGYSKNEYSERLRAALHEDVLGYVKALESGPFTNYPFRDLVYPLEESIDYLIELENTLLATQNTAMAYDLLAQHYVELLDAIVKSLGPSLVGTSIGEEYRAAWKRIASIGDGSPSAFVMKKVVMEMEASDWRISTTRNRLDIYNLLEALELARSGNLASFTLDENW